MAINGVKRHKKSASEAFSERWAGEEEWVAFPFLRLLLGLPSFSPTAEPGRPQAKFTINCYIPSVEVIYSGLTEA